MTTTLDRPVGHPVLACLEAVGQALAGADDAAVCFLPPEDRRAALLRLVGFEARLAALRLRLLAASDDLAAAEGARDVAALVTHLTRTSGTDNRRDLALAQALDQRWLVLAAGLSTGAVNLAQARVIVRALDDLPHGEVSGEVLAQAERHLVEQAAHFGPRELRLLGQRVLEVVAPDVAEMHEARLLAEQEQRAWRRTSLVSLRRGDGTTRVLLTVPDATAARLHTYLEAFSSPRRRGSGAGEQVPVEVRRGQAFCALLEACDPRRLPAHGGDATTVVVTVSLATLRAELGRGEIVSGDRLSAAEVRRLACTASIVPAVLGTRSEVLDLGRSARLFTPAQRKALLLRDRECRAEGCTVPAAWCEAHHAGRPVVAGWAHRPARRPAAVLVAPPPGSRPDLPVLPGAERGRAVRPAQLGAPQGDGEGHRSPGRPEAQRPDDRAGWRRE